MPESFKKLSAAVLEDFKNVLASKSTEELIEKPKAAADGGTFKVIISPSDEDRQGDLIDQTKWKLQNFENNPVVLWARDYYSLPIGVCTKIGCRAALKGRTIPVRCKFRVLKDRTVPHAPRGVALSRRGVISSSGVDGAVRTEDDGYVNVARIDRGRVYMCHFALQCERGEIVRFLSTTIPSMHYEKAPRFRGSRL
jgi:hypothetical protein